MRAFLREHLPTLGAAALLLAVLAGYAVALAPEAVPGATTTGLATPIPLPGPDEDRDRDSYADDVDLWDGDLVVEVEVDRLRVPGGSAARPYLLVGTQDDHWRLGEGAELEWRRVVDHDPLGHRAGSPEWIASALRTGAWWRSIPMEGETHAVAHGGTVDGPAEGVHWPQSFQVNVRDDREVVRVEVELWDAATRPHTRMGKWTLAVEVPEGLWRLQGDADAWSPGETAVLGDLGAGGSGVQVSLVLASDVPWAVRQEVAERWAPVLHFAEGERFFPTRGEALERFHGVWNREDDLRTWMRSFNNGRDAYRLLLADFTGDGVVDHQDAAVLTEVLRAGGVASDTVYSQVTRTTGGHVVVQYWFIYFYNFVPDETGRDIAALAHAGDREFMHLVFEDLEAARNGTPLRVAYSQHYKGVTVPYAEGLPPFHVDPGRPSVFVALGSHASYPAAGTDAALRPALAGFGDLFDGEGDVWRPADYDLEVLGSQEWHAGYLWGPVTRHSRDLGTAARPLLQHGFSYPFLDPLHWDSTLMVVEAELLEDLYGGAP